MGLDYISQIAISIPVTVDSKVIEEKITKYDEYTGKPYIKNEEKTITSYLVGNRSFSEIQFRDFCEINDLTFNEYIEELYSVILSLDKQDLEPVYFCISELEEAKNNLLNVLIKNGIKIDKEDIEFYLINHTY